MEKNISLKVSYQETNRRFAISKYTNWFELETAIRTLFSFPSTFTFALTYTDEDCDIITLRSDLELQDVLAQHQSSTLKFTVVPCDTQIRSCEDSNHEVTGYNISNPVIESPRLFSSIETNEDEVYFPEFKSDEKGKNKADYSFEKQNSSNHPETSSYDEQQNDEEQTITPPSIVLAAQFQKLVDQFRPLIEQQPQLMEQANVIMDQILRNMNVDIEKLTQWFKNQIANVQQNFSGTNTRSLEGEFQRIIQSGQNIAQSVRGIIPVKRCSSHHMTEEEKNEKLKLLREMGFWDDDQRNERLLKKYHGNINKVTEDLLRERNDTAEYTFIENEVQMEPIIFSNH